MAARVIGHEQIVTTERLELELQAEIRPAGKRSGPAPADHANDLLWDRARQRARGPRIHLKLREIRRRVREWIYFGE